MFYLNTIEQLFLFVEQLDQLEVCLPYSRLIAGIPILAVFQNLRWNSNKTPLLFLSLTQTYLPFTHYVAQYLINHFFLHELEQPLAVVRSQFLHFFHKFHNDPRIEYILV